MTKQVEAVYEQGRLRPLEPLELPEGARLRLILVHVGDLPHEVRACKAPALLRGVLSLHLREEYTIRVSVPDSG